MEHLGVAIDDKLTSDSYTNKLSISADCELKALFLLNFLFLSFQAKKNMKESFVYSKFSYCLLMRHICKGKSSQNIKNIQKRALHYLHDNFESEYFVVLQKLNKTTMTKKNLKT